MDFYAVQRLVGKIDDAPELRDAFIEVFDTKTKPELALFGLHLADHFVEFTGFQMRDEITDAFAAVREWLDGKAVYQKARSLAGEINDLARLEADPIKTKYYRAMAQIACIPHVKFHALWACDFAVALVNRIAPGDLATVGEERRIHIALLSQKNE